MLAGAARNDVKEVNDSDSFKDHNVVLEYDDDFVASAAAAAYAGSRRLPELEGESSFSLPTVTLASATMLLGGYLLFRCLRRCRSPPRPKRDSFGFLPDSRRTSFTHPEQMV